MHQPPQAGEEREGSLLDKPAARAQIVAAAALAGWHDGRAANGWWRHGDDDYGWVGPLFWPFAYDDIYSYVIFGNSVGFWDYGYADIFAGMFAPYGQQDLAAYLGPDPSGQRHRKIPPLQQFCGDDSREIAGLPVERIAQAIQPNDAQRAALDELADASINATRMIRASCPTQMVLTAPARLAVMGQRIETLIKAELALQPPLDKLFEALDDEQKARLNALADDRRKTAVANGADEAPAQACQGPQPGTLQWPGDEIAARLHPNDTQRAALDVLQAAGARALDMLNDVCQPGDALTAPARLAALDRRLDAMQHAVRLVSDALEEEPGTYFLTDFLARTFEHMVLRELGLDRHPELRDDYFGNYTRVLWLAQRPTLGTKLAAERAAAALGLPLEVREVGDAGLERALEQLITGS